MPTWTAERRAKQSAQMKQYWVEKKSEQVEWSTSSILSAMRAHTATNISLVRAVLMPEPDERNRAVLGYMMQEVARAASQASEKLMASVSPGVAREVAESIAAMEHSRQLRLSEMFEWRRVRANL